MERKQILSTRKQNGGGSSTPPPGTGGDFNGGRNPSERGGSSLQQSDDSEGEKQSGKLGSGAGVVHSSLASKGGFYRLGRGRELGFPEVAGAGKFSGRSGSVDDVRSRGRVMGDTAPPLACWHRSRNSATARSRVTGRQWRNFFSVHRPGSGLLQWGLDSGDGGDVIGYAEVAKDVRDDVGYSDVRFSEFLLTGCSVKCLHEFKFRIFENFHFGL
jgi:hypothetical protein